MATADWQQIKELFNQALDLEPAERKAFLADLRRDWPSLAEEVGSLLSSHDDTGTLFDELPSSQDLFGEKDDDLDRFRGQTIGRYRLNDRLGRGGMSTVFSATRLDGSSDEVAIKLLKPSQSQDVSIERFFDERQILAHLHHPNIARLADGGQTDDGVHYLVMEYIEGLPIDTYCQEHRLDLGARLGLLRTVCSAVHYAHRNLVVHRDLKPSNILVTADGTPKLLDFGIAKLLNADFTPTAGRTRSSRAPMTPDFASPEQFLGEPVSTASDVYSLGVLAYLLLTDASPYEPEGPTLAELARLVCTETPLRPSERVRQVGADDPWSFPDPPTILARSLDGDLDAVVGKALAKSPDQRYLSAEALAEDLRRWCSGLPVLARGNDFGYVVGTWLHRRRRWVALFGSLFLVAVVGLGILVQGWLAERQREEARARQGELLHLARALDIDNLDLERAAASGAAESRGPGDGDSLGDGLGLRETFERLSGLAADPEADSRLRFDASRALVRLGEKQASLGLSDPTGPAGSLACFRQARRALQTLLRERSVAPGVAGPPAPRADQPARDEILALTVRALDGMVEIAAVTGDLESAAAGSADLLAVRESQRASSPEDPVARRQLAEAHGRRAVFEHRLGRRDAARASFLRTIELLEELLQELPDERQVRRELMDVHEAWSGLLEDDRALEEALSHAQRILDLGRALADPAFEDQARFARAGLSIGRLEVALSGTAQEPERRRRLEVARYRLRRAIDQADELTRSGPLEATDGNLLDRIEQQLSAVEAELSVYASGAG